MAEHLTTLAETRARRALALAGLAPGMPLVRAESVTNEVFLSADHVIRVNRRPTGRLRREAELCRALPPRHWLPRVVAHGCETGLDYLVARRRPGATLARWWPMLNAEQRRSAAGQLADLLARLHQLPCPVGIPDLDTNPQLLDLRTPSPLLPIFHGIDRLRLRGDVDAGLLRAAEELLVTTGDAVVDRRPGRLVHGDLTLENVLWDGQVLTGLVDFEWARTAPADLDLDVLLRFCAYPGAHLPARLEDHATARDFAELPAWLRTAYPQLFAHPRLLDRLRIYALGFEVRQLLTSPPIPPGRPVDPFHPSRRLGALLGGVGHLDHFRQSELL